MGSTRRPAPAPALWSIGRSRIIPQVYSVDTLCWLTTERTTSTQLLNPTPHPPELTFGCRPRRHGSSPDHPVCAAGGDTTTTSRGTWRDPQGTILQLPGPCTAPVHSRARHSPQGSQEARREARHARGRHRTCRGREQRGIRMQTRCMRTTGQSTALTF